MGLFCGGGWAVSTGQFFLLLFLFAFSEAGLWMACFLVFPVLLHAAYDAAGGFFLFFFSELHGIGRYRAGFALLNCFCVQSTDFTVLFFLCSPYPDPVPVSSGTASVAFFKSG